VSVHGYSRPIRLVIARHGTELGIYTAHIFFRSCFTPLLADGQVADEVLNRDSGKGSEACGSCRIHASQGLAGGAGSCPSPAGGVTAKNHTAAAGPAAGDQRDETGSGGTENAEVAKLFNNQT
jgi:hypothetical protein